MGAAVVLTGCTVPHAVVLKRGRGGGVVALVGGNMDDDDNRAAAMKDAKKKMRKACGAPATVTEEGYEKVGETTSTLGYNQGGIRANERGEIVTGATGSTSTTTSDLNQYRVYFKCGHEDDDEGDEVSDDKPAPRQKRRH